MLINNTKNYVIDKFITLYCGYQRLNWRMLDWSMKYASQNKWHLWIAVEKKKNDATST